MTLSFYFNPKNVMTYVLLSNIYEDVGKWCEVQMVRRLMNDKGIKERSLDIVGLKTIRWCVFFCVGDRSHPQT